MPQPVHPGTPLVRCRWCPAVFVALTAADKAFASAHESSCPTSPAAQAAEAPIGCTCRVLGATFCPIHTPTVAVMPDSTAGSASATTRIFPPLQGDKPA
jgi:hypothetical protein